MNNKIILYIYPLFLNYYEFNEIYGVLNNYLSIILINKNNMKINFKNYKKILFVKYKIFFSKQMYYIPKLKNIIKENKPNIIVTVEIFSLTSFIVHILKSKYKYIHVIVIDENTDLNKSIWGLFPLTRFFSYFNRNSIFICSSKLSSSNLIKLKINENNIIIVNKSIFPIKNTKYHFKKNKKFKILFIGNLNENKGIKTLIKSFELIIKDGYNNIFLIIAGKGELDKFILEKSKEIKNIVYLGYVKDEIKLNLLNTCDLFVYPSEDIYFLKIFQRWKEQAAQSVVETMRAGLPIIASDSGSLPEILGRNDVIFEQKNYLELKEKILWLYKNSDIRKEIGEFNLKRFDTQFNIFKIAKIIEEKLNDIIDKN